MIAARLPAFRRLVFPKRQPWGPRKWKPVTVCIAAITREKLIVTASDTMVSYPLSSLDASTVKAEEFHEDWLALIAADDLTQCIPIMERARENFADKPNNFRVARACFKRAYRQHLDERMTDNVLAKFCTNMKQFRERGKILFTDTLYNQLASEIREIKGDCDFLICGFDAQGTPHLFSVTDPGKDEIYDKPGFAAIGSGLYAANGMLYQLGQTVDLNVYQTIFNVCAAKFTAERVSGVGKDTFLFVKKQGCRAFSRATWLLPTIRKVWEEQGQPRVPEGIIKQMETANLDFF
jgi:20S proteasome alpha/beta subunit